MARLIDKMEEAILRGDWAQLCSIYNKMTGKNISPPQIAQQSVPFDYMKSKKGPLLTKLKELGVQHGDNLTLSELREVYELNIKEEEEEEEKESEEENEDTDISKLNASPNPSFTYIPPSKAGRILNDDKNKMNARLADFPSYDDERKPLGKSVRSNKLINAKCRTCQQFSKIHPSKLIAGDTSDKTYICPKCS